MDGPYVVTVKSTVEISQNVFAFSEYMNFNNNKVFLCGMCFCNSHGSSNSMTFDIWWAENYLDIQASTQWFLPYQNCDLFWWISSENITMLCKACSNLSKNWWKFWFVVSDWNWKCLVMSKRRKLIYQKNIHCKSVQSDLNFIEEGLYSLWLLIVFVIFSTRKWPFFTYQIWLHPLQSKGTAYFLAIPITVWRKIERKKSYDI